ncbi:MAG TPA: M20/M25/M40 family metallo-hydrolase, partial [Gaiellaceae bacterium]
MAAVALRDEVTELLQELIRVDTTNPPGNETAAAELLRGYLEASGVSCELYAKVPERANLVARIPGSGDGPKLLFLSHTDVVLADASEWSADPFGGELRDGEVWGRGALDMKGQVAASAVAIASLAREGFEPAGDLIFAATADEEVGAGFGVQWLCEAEPDAVRCDYLINEGSGDRLVLGGKPFYICSVAEKMSAPFLLRVRGRSGHASMPAIADNALVKAAALITKLADYEPALELTPEVVALLEAVTGEKPATPGHALEQARAIGPAFGELVAPLLSLTLSPTMVTASRKRNVIPAVCDVTVDSRLQP